MNYFLTNNYRLLFPFKSIKEKFCAYYMYSNYDIHFTLKYFKLFSQYRPVDEIGKLMMNSFDDEKNWKDNAINLYSNYKFVLALESLKKDRYGSDKLLLPLFANSIPIYYGSPDIFKYINKRRVIYINDYKTDEDLLKSIMNLDKNDIIYNAKVKEDWFTPNYNFESITNLLLDERIKNILGFTPRDIYLIKKDNNNRNTIIHSDNNLESNLTFYHDYSIDNEFLLKKSILNWCNPCDNIIIKDEKDEKDEKDKKKNNYSFFSKKIIFFSVISLPFISIAIYYFSSLY